MRKTYIRTGRRGRPLRLSLALLAAAGALCLWTCGARLRRGAAQTFTGEAALPAQRAYLLSLCRCEDEPTARVEAARFAGRGTAGFLLSAEDGVFVIGAVYEREEDARKVARKVEAAEGIPCGVIVRESPAVTLSLNAVTRQERSALISGDATLREALSGLTRLSFALDAGEKDCGQAQEALSNLIAQADLAKAAIEDSPRLAEDPVGKGYLQMLGGLADGMRGLSEAGAPTVLAFSGRLKYLAVEHTLKLVDFLCALAAGT